jgi:CRISPR-associated protein Cmx8
MATITAPEAIEIHYDLSDLPTAQHKAGLAGMVLAIQSLAERSNKDQAAIPPESVPEIVEGPDESGVTIRFSQRSLQGLFDDLYDAAPVEAAVKAKWANATPKRVEINEEIDPKTKKKSQVKRFIYEVTQPKGTTLAAWFPEMPPDKGWLKLWRDMLWQIPRGNPQSREPFVQRAEDKPCKEGTAAWDSLVKWATRRGNAFVTGPVAGSLWLGAQAVNAEGVPFVGRVEQNLLLHFWPLTVMISVPQRIDNDGSNDFVGYVIAVPEVSRLKRFCKQLPGTFSELGDEVRGFRPARAVIDLPEQGALEFASAVARYKTAEEEVDPTRSVSSVEFLHLNRLGNNIKLLVSGRVVPEPGLIEAYRDIVGCEGTPPTCRNPLFRAALIKALLKGKPWWGEFLTLFMERDAAFFIATDSAPSGILHLPRFWNDARARLALDEETHQHRRKQAMQQAEGDPQTPLRDEPPPLTTLVSRLVRNYVTARAEQRSGVQLNKFREGDRTDWDRVPRAFHDEKVKVAEGLFLEFRSRREQAFVDHFAQTFFAVPQYMSSRDQEEVAQAMLFDRRIDDVKTLTLMALSAASWTPQRNAEKGTDA